MKLVLVVALGLAACKKPSEQPAPAKQVASPDAAPSGRAALWPIVAPVGGTPYAIYYAAKPKVPALEAANAVVAAHPSIHAVPMLKRESPRPAVFIDAPAIDRYPPPDRDGLDYLGVGLTAAERDALPAASEVLVLSFVWDGTSAAADNAEAMAVMAEIAAKTGGIVWDDGSRQAFGDAAWKERIATASAKPLQIRSVIAVHAYQPEPQGLVRVISIGMGKLALPDLVIENVPLSFQRAPDLLDAVALQLAGGGAIDAEGRLSVIAGARATVVELHVATPKEGDPDNRLWEIGFPGTGSLQERQAKALGELFGSEDSVVEHAGDDPELLAASARARAALMKLKPSVVAGLPEAERLTVKGPFAADGGTEYMWIEVTKWRGTKISGVLLDEPWHVPGLKAGASVEIDEASVFDYVLTHADGTTEGGDTNALLD